MDIYKHYFITYTYVHVYIIIRFSSIEIVCRFDSQSNTNNFNYQKPLSRNDLAMFLSHTDASSRFVFFSDKTIIYIVLLLVIKYVLDPLKAVICWSSRDLMT